MDAEYFIRTLHMEPHPEGGWFTEHLTGSRTMADYGCDRIESYGKPRRLWNCIYFLLRAGEVSNLHRLQSDELWFYHAGDPLTVYMIGTDGTLTAQKLGLCAENGEQPQVLVPAGYIFGSTPEGEGFSLVGCMCAPNFRYEEFELFERAELLKAYPQHRELITRLTPEKE